ncbi:MAG: hypothetical protein AAF724_11160 [Pseudomonadota bacterium]
MSSITFLILNDAERGSNLDKARKADKWRQRHCCRQAYPPGIMAWPYKARLIGCPMVLIGGTGTIFGPIVAAIALTFSTGSLAGIRGFEEARFIVIAVAMIVVLRVAPGGVLGLLDRLLLTDRR